MTDKKHKDNILQKTTTVILHTYQKKRNEAMKK